MLPVNQGKAAQKAGQTVWVLNTGEARCGCDITVTARFAYLANSQTEGINKHEENT